MKPRRITRQVLIKTSVASALVAVLAFIITYTAIIIATTSKDVDAIGERHVPLETHRRVHLLWSSKGRSRFQGRYSTLESEGRDPRTLPSRDWGYDQLVRKYAIQPVCPQNLLLLVIITSSPGNVQQREVIRDAWCSGSRHPSELTAKRKCVFLIGETSDRAQKAAVRLEARKKGDILLGNYSDTYRNLTYKVVSGFHWTVFECKPKFILKTDDDCFVNVNVLTDILSDYPEKDVPQLYVGNVFMETKELRVIRDNRSKWAVSHEDYAPEFYPKYASGTGYLVSTQVARRLLDASRTYKPFPNEDAYIGVLAESLGVSPIHSHRFTFVNTHWTMCNFLYLLVIHRISLKQQHELTKLADKAQVNCTKQRFFDAWS